jgi:hypothetical protein
MKRRHAAPGLCFVASFLERNERVRRRLETTAASRPAKPTRFITAKAGIKPWDTMKRRHKPGSHRKQCKASLVASRSRARHTFVKHGPCSIAAANRELIHLLLGVALVADFHVNFRHRQACPGDPFASLTHVRKARRVFDCRR